MTNSKIESKLATSPTLSLAALASFTASLLLAAIPSASAQTRNFYVGGSSNAGADAYQYHDFYNNYIDQLYTPDTRPPATGKWDYAPGEVGGEMGSRYNPNLTEGGLNVGPGVAEPSVGISGAAMPPGTEPSVEAAPKYMGALPEYETPNLSNLAHEASGVLAKMNEPLGHGATLDNGVSGLDAEGLGAEPMGMGAPFEGGGLDYGP